MGGRAWGGSPLPFGPTIQGGSVYGLSFSLVKNRDLGNVPPGTAAVGKRDF